MQIQIIFIRIDIGLKRLFCDRIKNVLKILSMNMVTKTEKNKVYRLLSFKKGTKIDFDLYLKTLISLVIGGHEKIISCTIVRVDEKAMRNRSGIH